MISPSRLALVAVFVTVVQAQTFVVDANNGPGTNFTDLPAAVASVPDGATLIVRAGSYSPFSVAGKGLTMLGEVGTTIFGSGPSQPTQFSSLNANQRAVMKGIGVVGHLRFQSCVGAVHVEDCHNSPCKLTVVSCSHVSLVRCVLYAGPTFSGSNVVGIECQFSAGGQGAGLQLLGGETQLVKCTVTGGPSGHTWNATPGIEMWPGSLRLLGPGAVTGGDAGGAAAIQGFFGSIRADASVVMTGAVLSGTAPPLHSFTLIDEASTTSTAASLGGTVTAKLEGSANLFGGLVIGFPQAPSTFPDIAEELWVYPLGFAISGGLGTPLTYWLDVPNDLALSGMLFGWQGLTLHPTAGFVLSNPAWFCVQ